MKKKKEKEINFLHKVLSDNLTLGEEKVDFKKHLQSIVDVFNQELNKPKRKRVK